MSLNRMHLVRYMSCLPYRSGPVQSLQNKAEEAEIQFALGQSDNTHDLLIAETKASVALQYTVAVRDKLIDAYKELMQMQV